MQMNRKYCFAAKAESGLQSANIKVRRYQIGNSLPLPGSTEVQGRWITMKGTEATSIRTVQLELASLLALV